jgi:hypothetical protein
MSFFCQLGVMMSLRKARAASHHGVLLEGAVEMTTFKIVVVLSMYELIFACTMRRRASSADRVFKKLSLSAPAKTFHSSRRLLNSHTKKILSKIHLYIY